MLKLIVLSSNDCKCCINIREKYAELQHRYGFEVEYHKLNDNDIEMPSDLTGLPYTIIIKDDIYQGSFQGDSPIEILEKKIEKYL